MESLQEFSIAFKGLKDGSHNYHFDIRHRFFGSFENSIIQDGELAVDLILDKRPDLMILHFKINGFIW